MDDQDPEVSLWMQQLSAGQSEAVQQIWQYCYERVVRHADRKLGQSPRRDADEEDIAVSALHSLFAGVREGRFPDFSNRADLWRILLTLASRKVTKRIRRQMTQKRGGGSVRGESVFALATDSQLGGLDDVGGKGDLPEFAELFSLECQDLLDQLDDENLRRIAVMRLQGYSKQEIAQELGCVVRSVDRKLSLIRMIWDEDHEQSAAGI